MRLVSNPAAKIILNIVALITLSFIGFFQYQGHHIWMIRVACRRLADVQYRTLAGMLMKEQGYF